MIPDRSKLRAWANLPAASWLDANWVKVEAIRFELLTRGWKMMSHMSR